MNVKNCCFFILLIMFGSSILFSQTQKFESHTKEIDRLIKEERSTAKKIEKRLKELRKKSEEISELKSKNSENILTNRKLQNLLSDSKEIANELDNLEEKRSQLNKSIQDKSSELIKRLDHELVRIFRNTKSIQRNSKEYKQGLKELTNIYQLRTNYIDFVEKSKYSIRLIPIEVSPNENEETLKTKLNLLKDQEDYLASINLIIQEQLNKSKEWDNLTHLADDLIEDIQVQQSQDEVIAASNAPSSSRTLSAESVKGGDFLYDNKTLSPNELVVPIEFENIYLFDREQLEKQIKKLQQFKNVVTNKIDSLSNIINQIR